MKKNVCVPNKGKNKMYDIYFLYEECPMRNFVSFNPSIFNQESQTNIIKIII